MQFLFAFILLIAGAFAALVGIVAAADPEGRGRSLVGLFYAGAAVALTGALWLLWLGWRFFSRLPVF